MSPTSRRCTLVITGVLATLPARLSAQQCEGLRPGRASSIVSAYAVSQIVTVALRSPDWWAGRDTTFHVVWDQSATGGPNHLLHAGLAYNLSQSAALAWDWACASPGAAGWLGAAIGFAFVLPKEIGDGFRRGFGFSGLSVLSSAVGAAMPAAHRTWKPSRAVVLKVNYWPSDEFRNGTAPPFPQIERDYAGQRYFIALDPGLALPGPGGWPDWLGIAFGHSVAEAYSDPIIPQWYVTLDVNLRGLPVRAPWWRSVAGVLDRFHVPLPGIKLEAGTMQFGVY